MKVRTQMRGFARALAVGAKYAVTERRPGALASSCGQKVEGINVIYFPAEF